MHRPSFPTAFLVLFAAAPLAQDCDLQVTVTPVGEASGGANGSPELRGVGAPIVDAAFAMRVLGGRAEGLGALLLSPNESPLFVPLYDATLQLGLPFLAQQTFLLDEAGDSDELLSVDGLPAALCGIDLIAQAFLADAAATGGVAFTNGLRVTTGVPQGPSFPNRAYDTEGNEASYLSTGDLDLDGHLDAVAVHRAAGGAAVFRGTGGGDVAAATFLEIPGIPTDAELATLDADAFPDLIVLTADTTELLVYSGLGDGSFSAPTTSVVGGPEPTGFALGDLDADGVLDVVVTHDGTSSASASVWLGTGDGTFSANGVLATGVQPRDPELHDFDGDDELDLVVAHFGDESFAIHAGLGGGVFAAPVTLSVSVSPQAALPWSVEIGDWNGDGSSDLAIGTAYGGFGLWLGDGAGAFTAVPGEDVAWGVWALAAGDLDGDGVDELIQSRFFLASNELWLQRDLTAAVADETELMVWGDHADLELVDFDSDGTTDLLALDREHDRLVVFQALAAGEFLPVVDVDAGFPSYVYAFADFDGDHIPDELGRSHEDELAYTALGIGDGTFGPPVLLEDIPFSGPVYVAELTGDGHLDLALVDDDGPEEQNRVLVHAGAGDGTFDSTPVTSLLADRPASVFDAVYADVDADGVADLLIPLELEDKVFVYRNDGSGAFAMSDWVEGRQESVVRTGDVNGDGWIDVLTEAVGSSNLLVHAGLGAGAFSDTPGVVSTFGKNTGWELGDVTEDGALDIVSFKTGDIVLLTGVGDGTFAPDSSIGSTGYGELLAFGDWNGDGAVDVAAYNDLDKELLIFNGVGTGPFGPIETYSFAPLGRLGTADFDADGVDDLAVNGSPLLSRVLH